MDADYFASGDFIKKIFFLMFFCLFFFLLLNKWTEIFVPLLCYSQESCIYFKDLYSSFLGEVRNVSMSEFVKITAV